MQETARILGTLLIVEPERAISGDDRVLLHHEPGHLDTHPEPPPHHSEAEDQDAPPTGEATGPHG